MKGSLLFEMVKSLKAGRTRGGVCAHVVVMVGRAAAAWAAAGLIRDHVLTALCIPAVCGSLCALTLTLHRQNHETEQQEQRSSPTFGSSTVCQHSRVAVLGACVCFYRVAFRNDT